VFPRNLESTLLVI